MADRMISDEFEVEIVDEEVVEEAGEGGSVSVLTKEQEEEVAEWLGEEIERSEGDLEASLFQDVRKWREKLDSPEASVAGVASAFETPSKVNVPLIQSMFYPLFAEVFGSFDARDPLFVVKPFDPTNEELLKLTKVVQKYLNMLVNNPTEVGKRWLADWIYETIFTGTGVVRVGWTTASWRVKRPDGSDREVVYKDGPDVQAITTEQFIYPSVIDDVMRLPWCAIKFQLSALELKERGARGVYDPDRVEEVLAYARRELGVDEEMREEMSGRRATEAPDLIDLYEVHFYYDVDGSGIPVDIVAVYHKETETILASAYNTLGHRGLVVGRYFHKARSLRGKGVGQVLEALQDEVTTIHNLRIENMKIANVRIFAASPEGVMKRKRIKVKAGTVIELPPDGRFQAVPIGEVYPSSLQAEYHSMQLAQRAVGYSEVQAGFSDSMLRSRDTARGQLLRMQRGDSILSNIVKELERNLSEIGMLVWMQCVLHKERVMMRERMVRRLSEEELGLLEQALSIDVADVPTMLQFSIKGADIEDTYEQKRMDLLALTQVYAQYAQQTIQLAAQVFGPQGMQLAQQAPELWDYMARILVGSGRMMEMVMKFFGEEDTQNYITNLEELDRLLDEIKREGIPGTTVMARLMAEMQKMQMMQGGAAGPTPVVPPVEEAPVGGQENNL